MLCPVCYNKIKTENGVCAYCGFKKSDLSTAKASEVKKARKEGRYDDIIYSSEFPSDLDYKKTVLLTVFLGWLGLHNFYVNKPYKGIFVLVSIILTVIFSNGLIFGLFPENFVNFSIYFFMAGAISAIMWLFDIAALLFKNFKVPVVIQKNKR
ncbi:MAG: NINE protein [Spirochaetales bacterium]